MTITMFKYLNWNVLLLFYKLGVIIYDINCKLLVLCQEMFSLKIFLNTTDINELIITEHLLINFLNDIGPIKQ